MSSTDNYVINPRERPLSTDVTAKDDLIVRSFADVMGFMFGSWLDGYAQESVSVNEKNQDTVYFDSVVMGLAAVRNAADSSKITLAPGVLIQTSATLAPTPGLRDSKTRIAHSRVDLSVDLPVAHSGYALLEIQAVPVITENASRDIVNTVTGRFEATNVTKQIELRLATQWVLGAGTIPAPSGGDWVPVLAANVSSGLLTDNRRLIDVRPLPALREGAFGRRTHFSRRAAFARLETVAIPGTPSSDVWLTVDEAWSNQSKAGQGGGLRLHSLANDAQLPGVALAQDPGTTFAADTWYYIYIAPWFDYAPEAISTTVAFIRRGVVVISDVEPREGFNNGLITLPGIFGEYVVPLYQAPCVGALYRNAGNDGWQPCAGHAGHLVFGENNLFPPILGSSSGAAATSRTVSIAAGLLPKCAKTIKLRVQVTFATTTASATGKLVAVRFASASNNYQDRRLQHSGTAGAHSVDLEMVVKEGEAIEVYAESPTVDLTDVDVYLVGYDM